MFDRKLLETLTAVVEHQGFDKAAGELCITQSAVSQRIRHLEDQVGQALLIRATPIKATSAGLKLVRHYRQLRLLEDEVRRELSGPEGETAVPLSLGVNADSLATWFLDAVRPFAASGRVLLNIVVDDQDQTHHLLRNGEVDGCVSTLSAPVQGGITKPLGKMRYICAASPEFAKQHFANGADAHAFRTAPTVVFNKKDELPFLYLNRFFGVERAEVPYHMVPSADVFFEAVTTGLAYAMIPMMQAAPLLKSGQLVNLAPGTTMEVSLHWHCWAVQANLMKEISQRVVDYAEAVLK